jgi:hypothetical protein
MVDWVKDAIIGCYGLNLINCSPNQLNQLLTQSTQSTAHPINLINNLT